MSGPASRPGPGDSPRFEPLRREEGALRVECAGVEDLASRFGTPLYVYSSGAIRDRLARLTAAFRLPASAVHYSVKANSNRALLQLLAAAGAGFDVVSIGEVERCRRAGIDPARLVFAGVGKTAAEIAAALAVGVGLFVVESADELLLLGGLAAAPRSGRPDGAGPVRFALRLNPDVDAGTHEYVTTGRKQTKFGLPLADALAALHRSASVVSLRFVGFHAHIGSQVREPARFAELAAEIAAAVAATRSAGFPVVELDLGGGFAADYREEPAPAIEAVAAAVRPILDGLGVELMLEPGRYLVAEAGVLVTRVIRVKAAAERTFVIVNAAMNDLLRPALYDARHAVLPVRAAPPDRPHARFDVVGPICESADFLARDVDLALPVPGDLLAIASAGAYGMSMSSQYNSRPRAAEVLVDGAAVRQIRRRETLDDLMGPELIGPELGLAD